MLLISQKTHTDLLKHTHRLYLNIHLSNINCHPHYYHSKKIPVGITAHYLLQLENCQRTSFHPVTVSAATFRNNIFRFPVLTFSHSLCSCFIFHTHKVWGPTLRDTGNGERKKSLYWRGHSFILTPVTSLGLHLPLGTLCLRILPLHLLSQVHCNVNLNPCLPGRKLKMHPYIT